MSFERAPRRPIICVLSLCLMLACESPLKSTRHTPAPAPAASNTALVAEPAPSLPESGPCLDARPAMGLPTQVLRHQGRLYVVTDDGGLTSFDDTYASDRRHLIGERVVALHQTREGELWALSEDTASHHSRVWRLRGAEWAPSPPVRLLAGDDPIALVERQGQPVILLSAALVTLNASGEPSRLALASPLSKGLQPVVGLTDAGFLYVGVNRGEFGGGLRRIDVTTGAVESVERRDSESLCAGPLNAQCDPVTGIVVDGRAADCVWASVGLAHMGFDEGRVLHVCADRVDVDFERLRSGANSSIPSSEPMIGLAARGDGYLASTPTQVYEVHDRVGAPLPWKSSAEHRGFLIGDLAPGVVAVFTTINNRHSVSGAMPLVASESSSDRHAPQ